MVYKEYTLRSLHGERPFLLDIRYLPNGKPKPVVLFVHGFKGFKDWGPFNLIADLFAKAGFVYAKLNLSHNGTTPESPNDFADLEAFGRNNYLIELDDLKVGLDFLDGLELGQDSDGQGYHLIGHSRGGGLVILKGSEDARVKSVSSWAGVGTYAIKESDKRIAEWKEKGVAHIWNSRTEQNMPIYYQFYEVILNNSERLDIGKAAANLSAPLLLAHGTADETVPHQAALDLQEKQVDAALMLLGGAGHTFGGTHPFEADELPQDLASVVSVTMEHIKEAAEV